MEEKIVSATIQGGFASIASAFVVESLEHMIPWLFVMFIVIVTDLVFGVRKSLLEGERVRFSRAVRATMGKMVTYFAFVCMVSMISVAMGGHTKIEMYSCMAVCFIEICSIFGNLLKPAGYDLNVIGVLRLAINRFMKVDKEDVNEIIKKRHERTKRTKKQ